LVLLSDPAAGEDGFLQSSEIVQLRLNAELVVLSACDTAVGPLEGQEGVATLSRAFLLAGARTVVSTLWSVDDESSAFLMKRFYAAVSNGLPPTESLAVAKRDFQQKFGSKAVPYYWAGYTIEGGVGRSTLGLQKNAKNHVAQLTSTPENTRVN
jgi:CHAT domain-containing protein